MDIKFDYDRFGKEMEGAARFDKSSVESFTKGVDANFRILSSADCIGLGDLYNRLPKTEPAKRKHIMGCNFCRRLIKVMHICYLTLPERQTLYQSLYPLGESRPKFEDCFAMFASEEPTKECMNLVHLLKFHQLAPKRRAHLKKCARCAAMIGFVKLMPMPQL